MAADTRNQLTADLSGRAPQTAAAPSAPPVTPSPGPLPGVPAAPVAVPLPDAQGLGDAHDPVPAHGCWYPSADPSGVHLAFICNRGGVPQLWTGPVNGGESHLLDSGPDPVREVSWSPDGRWIAYTTAPGGGEHTRVLCVHPDGTGRRILGGAEPGTTAYLGRWAPDGTAVAVTVAPAAGPGAPGPDGAAVTVAEEPLTTFPGTGSRPPGWDCRDGPAVLLGGAPWEGAGPVPSAPGERLQIPAPALTPLPAAGSSPGGLAAYLVDPDGVSSPVLLAAEVGAAVLRVCDLTSDSRFALLLHGPRGRREAVVVRTAGLEAACTVPVADGDPWIGRFSPDGRRVWLRSDTGREFAALLTADLGPEGECRGLSVAAGRDDADLELLSFTQDGRSAALAWNVGGRTELEVVDLPGAGQAGPLGPARTVELPHEVVTRINPAGPGGGLTLALSGSVRRPGVWWTSADTAPVRTTWSSRDQDAVAPGRPPVRPDLLRLRARDGLPLGGWYYRAPGGGPERPAPCVIHLHGGPEDQERPVFDPLYHEILGRGIDVFAPDVRGSSGWGRSFMDADLGGGRFSAIDDVADCAAHAVQTGLADPGRLAVMGRSYGGYLTLASLVWHPELFRTGVSVCGMSDLLTFFAGTEPWIAESAAAKYGHPERDRDLLHALSPMSRVAALRVPLLTVHGEHDTNVPPGESEQIVRAARERGIPAELLVLREEGHEFLRTGNRVLFRRTAADWLEDHLTG
ncbi:prolyl oligopeptidase family serine peptidase [Streptacidiphilus griseoplanus]|uniref:prolyl oligopeptidase family serine peptidase n=1 Tax=Peterkaempfera griseoplana TaxID=66896 RepID=UPI0006E259D0|nr:prolyl oligopeptidase family serine peptidase [Peterkaempfera griseoplana]